MPIVVSDSSKDFKPAPEGLHQSVCVDVIDLGMLPNAFREGKLQHKISIVWQIAERDGETGKRFIVSKRYTASLHEKATLRGDLEAWRGKRFSDQELKGFDVEAVLGVNCQLQVIHNENKGKVYGNVAAIVPLGKGTPKLEGEGYIRKKDRVDGPDDNGHAEEFQATDDDLPF